jgi:regulator of sigma E protease
MLSILIVFFSLIILIIIHEFGHFILAKKFGVDIEEFGIGYPPRIIGKKIGNTIYSLNLLPFGAFVKIKGEEEEIENLKSFSKKPIWQRLMIILGGAIAFWLVAWILISISMNLGMPKAISDEEIVPEAKVQIIGIAKNSPAENAGLKIGDYILEAESEKEKIEKIQKVKEIQDFTDLNLGKEILLTIERGKKILKIELIPREKPPEGEGPMGVVLSRVTFVSLPWYKAIFEGFSNLANITFLIFSSIPKILSEIFFKRKIPPGVEIVGPIGIFGLASQMITLGFSYYLRFLALIAIYLAIFNLFPIPALDGGKILFLGIEALRKKPISKEAERKITAFFFALLISLMIFITIRDIKRIF